MKRQKRDRHSAKGDRDDRLAQMARKDPGEKARERMRRPAYAPGELSFQARRLIRHQGRQMEHKTVEEYIRDKGMIGSGQKNIKAVQAASERDRSAEQETE